MSTHLLIDDPVDTSQKNVNIGQHILGDFYCKEIGDDKLYFAGHENKQDTETCTAIFKADQKDTTLKLPKSPCHRIYLGLTTPKTINRTVFASMTVNRLCDINTTNQTFKMRFSVYLNWLPTELEYLTYIRLLKSGNRDGLLDWRPDWTPLFDFVNTTDSLTKDTVRWEFKQNYGKFRIKRIPNFFKDFNNNDIVNDNYQSKDGTLFDSNNFDGNSALFICCRLNCDLTFAQEFDLSHFPFDCQDLSLLMCDRTTERYRVKFLPYLSGIRHRFVTIDSTYSVLNDWIVDSVFLSFDHRLHGRGHQSLAFIELRINLRRKWESYLWRQFFFEFFFSAVGLTSFAIHYDLSDRLILLVTLLLTMVAFSLVLDDKIPNVPYLTYLEKYIFINYAFLAYLLCVSIWSYYYSIGTLFVFWWSLGIFLVVQLIFGVYGWYVRWYEMVKVNCPFHERKQYMNKEKGVFGVDYEINDILKYSASIKFDGGFTCGNTDVMNTIEHDYSNGYNDQRHHLPMNQLSFRQSVDTTLDNLTQLKLKESYDKLKKHSMHVSKGSTMYNSYQNEESRKLIDN